MAGLIRRMGISEQTFYRWRKVYGGLGVGELRRLKLLEEENCKLKQLVADLSLDKHISCKMCCQKALTPGRRREIVAHVQASHGVSERRSCSVLGVDRLSVRYMSHQPDQAPRRTDRSRRSIAPSLCVPGARPGREAREPESERPSLRLRFDRHGLKITEARQDQEDEGCYQDHGDEPGRWRHHARCEPRAGDHDGRPHRAA